MVAALKLKAGLPLISINPAGNTAFVSVTKIKESAASGFSASLSLWVSTAGSAPQAVTIIKKQISLHRVVNCLLLASGSYLVSTILRVLPALTMFVGWNPTDWRHQVGTWRQRGKTKKAAPELGTAYQLLNILTNGLIAQKPNTYSSPQSRKAGKNAPN
jgi:hypothetical protein